MMAQEFDYQVRRYVYEATLKRGYPPAISEASAHFGVPASEVGDAFRRLAAGRVLVLQPDTGEILMASPFSGVPTPFVVELAGYSCFGNCIWDALGIAAMTGQDARIKTSCGDCGAATEVRVGGGAVQNPEGLAHFAVPARHWWDDIVFNLKTMLLFRSEEHIERWCRSWRLDRGATLTLEQVWGLAKAFYGPDRREPGWRRKTLEETEAVFAELGLTSPFWHLRS